MKRCLISALALLLVFTVCFSVFLFVDDKSSVVSSADINQDFCVIIDAGHGGEDGGTSSADGTLEKDINLSVAKALQKLLETAGYNTVMTRTDDNQIGDITLPTIRQRKVSDIKKRLEITEQHKNSILISIHQNHYTSSQYSGTQVFYSQNSTYSKILADSIQYSVVDKLQKNNNRLTKAVGTNIYLLYNCKIPSVMVECGFMSNPNEAELLKDPDYQKKIAFSVMCGIIDFLEDKDG